MNLSLNHRPDAEAEAERFFDPNHGPVDLNHLSRYTMGDAAIEREVLELFRRQMRVYFDKLAQSENEALWQEAARVLKASARSVGAWQLLKTIETGEKPYQSGTACSRQEFLRALSGQIEEAILFIDSILQAGSHFSVCRGGSVALFRLYNGSDVLVTPAA